MLSKKDYRNLESLGGYLSHPDILCKPSTPGIKFTSRGTRVDRVFYPSNWIEHRKYDSSLLGFYREGRRDELLTTDLLLDEERGEFVRFYDALFLWEYYCPKEEAHYDGQFYWQNSIERGPEFAEWCKDYFAYSYRRTWAIDGYSAPWFDSTKPLKGYNDVFPYQGLLKFKEEVEDYLLSLTPTGSPLEEDLDKFEIHLRELISKIPELEIVSEFEILAEPSTSSSFIEKTCEVKPSCFIRENNFSDEMVGVRCLVPVYPAGTRDTIILEKASSNTVRLLERQMRHILEKVPESAVCLFPDTFRRRIEAVKKPGFAVHLLRDIKKCGLTTPMRYLTKIFVKVMQEYFPNPIWEKFLIYDQRRMKLSRDKNINDWVWPSRGYFLGMANHLVTLFLIVMHRMALHQTREDYPDIQFKTIGIFGNDDADIRISLKGEVKYDYDILLDIAEGYSNNHEEAIRSLGCWYNTKKSFLSFYPLFYEEYGIETFEKKQSRYAMILASCMTLPHIRMMKSNLRSFLMTLEELDTSALACMLDYVVNIVGIELDPDEVKRDYYLGGWIPKRSNYLSDVLHEIPDCDRDHRYLRRVFDYVQKYDTMSTHHVSSVQNPEDNWHPLLRAMQISGKPPQNLSSLIMSRENRERYYRRLVVLERNAKSVSNECTQLWKKYKAKSYDEPIEKLYTHIISKVDCTIPDFLIKSYDKGPLNIVSSTWYLNNEIQTPNRLIKLIIANVDGKRLKSDLDLPVWEHWKYLNLQSKLTLPKFVVEYPYIPITKDESAYHFSSSSFASLMEYAVRVGKFPKDFLIELPKREIPPWRLDPDIIRYPCEGIEEVLERYTEVRPDEDDLKYLGIYRIKRVDVPLPNYLINEGSSHSSESDYDEKPPDKPIEEPKEDPRDIFYNVIKELKGISEGFRETLSSNQEEEEVHQEIESENTPIIEEVDSEKAPTLEEIESEDTPILEVKDPPPLEIHEGEKLLFSSDYWNALADNPALRTTFIDEPCQAHLVTGFCSEPQINRKRRCLLCSFWMINPLNPGMGHAQLRDQNNRIYVPIEELLRNLGYDPPASLADILAGDDDEDIGLDFF